jgi:uncharacterized protein YdaU (DUF1376 family)
MALRDQPYLPLYVQDFLTDEKLMECSASATGVYIRIMCVMHKAETYGKILLKQKDKQTGNQIKDFALKLAKHLPYDLDTVLAGIKELCQEKCLIIEGDYLVQKRMVDDGELSLTRSKSGHKGGKTTQSKNKKFAKAKNEANTEYEIEYDNDIDNNVLNSKKKTKNMSTAKDTEGIPLPFKSPNFASMWSEWLQHRKEARIKNYTPTGLRRLFKWLVETSGGDEQVAIQIIDQSLTKGWQGLFELKTLPNATNIPNTSAGNKQANGNSSSARISSIKNF